MAGTDAAHGDDESEEDCTNDGEPVVFPAECRTVMIRNIPCRCSEEEVLAAVHELGFRGHNYFHMPWRGTREKVQACGYAFIGFEDTETTRRFAAAMTGYVFANRNSLKVVQIVPAHIEGSDPRSHAKGNKRKKPNGDNNDAANGGSKRPRVDQAQSKARRQPSLDAPLTYEELASLDERGSSKPSWLTGSDSDIYRRLIGN